MSPSCTAFTHAEGVAINPPVSFVTSNAVSHEPAGFREQHAWFMLHGWGAKAPHTPHLKLRPGGRRRFLFCMPIGPMRRKFE